MATPGYRTLILPVGLTASALVLLGFASDPATRLPFEPAGPALGALRHVAGIVFWLALAWLGGRIFDLVLYRSVSARRMVQYPRLLGDLLRVVLFALAVVAILAFVFEGTATGMIATSGVLIAVIGFALRNIIADVFSGIALSFEHPYRIGDWVEPAPGTVGRVVEINWRATRLLTRDGTSITVPNGLIAGARLVNYSHPHPEFRTSLRVPLDANVPVERAKRVLLSGALDAGRAFPELKPDVMLQEYAETGIVYAVRFWVQDYALENAARDAVATGVLHSLQRAGLAPAYPKRDLVVARERSAEPQRRLGRDELLAGIDLFAPFAEGERREIAEHMEERCVAKGEVVVAQGAPGDSLFILAEGALDVRAAADGAGEIELDRMVPGDVLGEGSLLTGEPRSASVVAATDAVLYEIRRRHLEPHLKARPAIAEGLAAVMAGRRRHNAERLSAGRASADELPAPADFLGRLRSLFGLTARH